jgi:photosystem II stability/assembly factor-like uncharacterized protein
MYKWLHIVLMIAVSVTSAQNNWQQLTAPTIEKYFLNSVTINKNGTHGWAVGHVSVYPDQRYFIIKTTNGGTTWQEKTNGIPLNFKALRTLASVSFPNASYGYCAGSYGGLFKTTDGGENWTQLQWGGDTTLSFNLASVAFIDINTGWIMSNNVVKKTTDGGASWTPQLQSFYTGKKLIVQDIYTVWSITDYIHRTTDGGAHWNKINVNDSLSFSQGSFLTNYEGWLMGNYYGMYSKYGNYIYHTTDAGLHWTNSLFPKGSTGVYWQANDMVFVYPKYGWVCGGGGEIYMTTDGGTTWTDDYDASTDIYHLHALDANHVWAVGTNDVISSTTTGIYFRTGPNDVRDLTNATPIHFSLEQNYPNPFNPNTTISYQLSKQSHVTLKVFNVLGQEDAMLVNGVEEPGNKSVNFNAGNLPSGVYYYRLQAGSFVETKKLLLIR